MTTDLALIVSLISIAGAVWCFFRCKNKRYVKGKVGDKVRELRSLEESVKNLSKEIKDD